MTSRQARQPFTASSSKILIVPAADAISYGECLSQREKLLDAICANPRNVRYDDACKAAVWIGYIFTGGKGSHTAFQRLGDPVGLNFQKRQDGKIKPYQGRQLANAIARYRDRGGQED